MQFMHKKGTIKGVEHRGYNFFTHMIYMYHRSNIVQGSVVETEATASQAEGVFDYIDNPKEDEVVVFRSFLKVGLRFPIHKMIVDNDLKEGANIKDKIKTPIHTSFGSKMNLEGLVQYIFELYCLAYHN
ncbi:hypothetical protein ACJX0J_033565, partial [Zea mays]